MMVDFFRRKMKVFIWLIVATFVLSIFLIAGGSYFYDAAKPKKPAQAAKPAKPLEPKSELDFEAKTPVATIVFKGQTETITEGELNRAVENAKNNNRIYRGSSISLKTLKTMMGPILVDNLVKERLVLMEAESQDMDVSVEVDEAVKQQYDRVGGKEKFFELAKLDEAELRGILEKQLKQNRVVQRITAGKSIDDAAVEAYYKAHTDEFKAAEGDAARPLTEVRGEIERKLRAQVTDADIAAYYEQHKARWQKPDMVDVRHLMLDPESSKWRNAVEVTTSEIQVHYEKNQADYKAPKKVRLKHIFLDPDHESFADAGKIDDSKLRSIYDERFPAEPAMQIQEIKVTLGDTAESSAVARKTIDAVLTGLKEGTAFADLAKQHSSGDEAANGGDRGLVKAGDLQTEVANAVAGMEPGQVSSVIDTGDALQVIKLVRHADETDEDPTRDKDFEEMKEQLARDESLKHRRDAARDRLKDIRASIVGDEMTFEASATQFSHAGSAKTGGELGVIVLGDNKENPLIEEVGTSGYLDENLTDAVIDLRSDEISPPVRSALGFHLVKLVETLPSETRSLADVTPEIEQLLSEQKADQLVQEALERIKAELAAEPKVGETRRTFEEIVKAESDGSDARDGGLWTKLVLSSDEKPALGDIVREEIYSLRALHPKIIDAVKPLAETEVSDTVTFGRTHHLFQLVTRHPVRYIELDDAVRDEIRETLNPDVSETEIAEYFEANKDEFGTPAKVTLRHILLRSEDAANERLKEALEGADFEYLARQYSQDPTTKSKGGLISSEVNIPEIKAAMAEAEPGKVYPKPVKTFLGWHVLQLVSRSGAKEPSLDEARDSIRSRLLPEKREKVLKAWIEELENQAIIRKHFPAL